MKRIILIFFIVFLLQGSMFSLVKSGIKGLILDSVTKKPVKGALVILYKQRIFNYNGYTEEYSSEDVPGRMKTGDSGEFKFYNIVYGNYVIQIFKEGYAAFGPRMHYKYITTGITKFGAPAYKVHATPPYKFYVEKPNKVKYFRVKEGRIKYLIINLKKEAVLEIRVFEKDKSGIKPRPFRIVSARHSEYIDEYFDSYNKFYMNGVARTKYFGSGSVDIVFKSGSNYPVFKIKNIKLESGKTTVIKRTCDFTSGQGIYGIIRDKKTKKPVYDATIIIDRRKSDEHYITSTNKNGFYRFGGISSGKYDIFIEFTDYEPDPNIEYKLKGIIKIGKNERKSYNRFLPIFKDSK